MQHSHEAAEENERWIRAECEVELY
jgi:hypothetical protein